MTLRELVSMYRGLTDFQISILKAKRLDGFWTCANIIAAILNSAGKSLENEVSAKDIFDQMSGEGKPPPVTDEHYEYEGGSLAALKEERRLREEAAKAGA